MNRPKIKIEKTRVDKSIEILTFLLILSSGILIDYYNQLPNKLPIHFNWHQKIKMDWDKRLTLGKSNNLWNTWNRFIN